MMNFKAHYANPTAIIERVEVLGITYTIAKLPAFEGMKLFHKVMKVASPLVSVFLDTKKEFNIAKLDFDDEALSDVIKKIVEMCQKDGNMIIFDMDMKDLKTPYLLAFEFLKFNYSDFLQNSPKLKEAVAKVDGLDLSKMKI
jgi:hypothetical protein